MTGVTKTSTNMTDVTKFSAISLPKPGTVVLVGTEARRVITDGQTHTSRALWGDGYVWLRIPPPPLRPPSHSSTP